MSNANSIKVEGLVAPKPTSKYARVAGLMDARCVLGSIYSDLFSQQYGEFKSCGLRLVFLGSVPCCQCGALSKHEHRGSSPSKRQTS
jgi:hypothetical protein